MLTAVLLIMAKPRISRSVFVWVTGYTSSGTSPQRILPSKKKKQTMIHVTAWMNLKCIEWKKARLKRVYERYSASLVIREMEIKTTVSYSHTPVRIKKTDHDHTKC